MSGQKRCTCEGCPHPWTDPNCPFHGAKIVNSAAQERGAVRLLAARGSIRDAFGGLDLDWDLDDLYAYLLGSPGFQAISEPERGKVLGLIAGFAIVAVERGRELPAEHPHPALSQEQRERLERAAVLLDEAAVVDTNRGFPVCAENSRVSAAFLRDLATGGDGS